MQSATFRDGREKCQDQDETLSREAGGMFCRSKQGYSYHSHLVATTSIRWFMTLLLNMYIPIHLQISPQHPRTKSPKQSTIRSSTHFSTDKPFKRSVGVASGPEHQTTAPCGDRRRSLLASQGAWMERPGCTWLWGPPQQAPHISNIL